MTYEKVGCVHGELIILCIESNPQESRLGIEVRFALDVIVDLVLGVKVRYNIFPIGNFPSIRESAPN